MCEGKPGLDCQRKERQSEKEKVERHCCYLMNA